MGDKKSIAFYTCSNGLGHYKRVYEVAKLLTDFYDITIYCTQYQSQKIGTIAGASYVHYRLDNIRWDKTLQGDVLDSLNDYFDWLIEYGDTVHSYDLVISDNIVGLLQYRKDIILMGSFFWHDVYETYIGENYLSFSDRDILNNVQPTVITNKYTETQSMKVYNSKKQFGFGCTEHFNQTKPIKYILPLYPSLEYSKGYSNKINEIITASKFAIKENLSYIDNICIVARPGVGTITHCVEYSIPLIALYSNKDSSEIIELAQSIEDLGIGFKQNIDEPINLSKLDGLTDNSNFINTVNVEKEGYKNIAEYLKSI